MHPPTDVPGRTCSVSRYRVTSRPANLALVPNQERESQTYAWNWFALHASQRLQLVNFWLVAVAFLATAFVQARASHLNAVALGVSVTGVVSSLAFWRLDVRTQQLVQVAEDALQHFEENLVATGEDRVVQLVLASAQIRRSRFDSYRVIIRGLQLSVAAMFAVAAIYTIVKV